MTINESRLKSGQVTLGPVGTGQMDVSCQITNCRITSAYDDDGDPLETLCGDQVPAGRKLSGRKLEGTIVQDFDLAEASGGVIDYLWNHDLEVVDFSFVPDTKGAPTITGQVMLEVPADSYGGDVNTRLTSDFAWNIQSQLTRTYGAGGAAQSAAAEPASAPA